jgi:hypothetical protein
MSAIGPLRTCACALQCPLSEVKRTLGHPLLVADEVFGSEANAPYAGPILLGPCAKDDSDEGVKK